MNKTELIMCVTEETKLNKKMLKKLLILFFQVYKKHLFKMIKFK